MGDVLQMLIERFGEDMPAGSVGDKVEILAVSRVRDRFERRPAGVANRSGRQPVDDVGVIGRRLVQVGLGDAAAERALAQRQAVDNRRVGS